jgi:hypothetical protein
MLLKSIMGVYYQHIHFWQVSLTSGITATAFPPLCGSKPARVPGVTDVAKARGMTAIAASTGLGRESLYKALAPGAKPRYETIVKVLHGLGVRLTVQP